MTAKSLKFYIAAALQIIILLVVIGVKSYTLSNGTNIFLKVEPVDPKDPFRGDYITLSFNISQIDSYYFQPVGELKNGQTVYVELEKNSDKSWEVSNVLDYQPTEGIFIKGKIISGAQNINPQAAYDYYSDSSVRVSYGIEDYFIPENSGQNTNLFGDNIYARVAIDNKGQAILKNIYINGKIWP